MVGIQNNIFQHKSIHRSGSNNSYVIRNSNNNSEWNPSHSSSKIRNIVNQLDNKYNTTPNKKSKNNQTKSNDIQGSMQNMTLRYKITYSVERI